MSARYELLDSGETLLFSDAVLEYFEQHRQNRRWHREAGGPLFVRTIGAEHIVEVACGPFKKDRRSRFSLRPHRQSMQECIDQQWQLGRHYIGSWHTHPELNPTPSNTDLRTMRDLFDKSIHQTNAFVFAIVGFGDLPSSLFVAAWTNGQCNSLLPKKSGSLEKCVGKKREFQQKCDLK